MDNIVCVAVSKELQIPSKDVIWEAYWINTTRGWSAMVFWPRYQRRNLFRSCWKSSGVSASKVFGLVLVILCCYSLNFDVWKIYLNLLGFIIKQGFIIFNQCRCTGNDNKLSLVRILLSKKQRNLTFWAKAGNAQITVRPRKNFITPPPECQRPASTTLASAPVNSIYLPGMITFSHLAVKKWSFVWARREQWRQPSTPFPRHIVRQFRSPYMPSPRAVNCHAIIIVRQFQSPYTPSPRGLSRISAHQVALALASRFSRMLSFQIKDMEFTGLLFPCPASVVT
jgi:hypothetical protein